MMQTYRRNRKKYFQSYLPTLLLLIFSWTNAFSTECDQLVVTTSNSSIQITNIEAPKAIIKIFDTISKFSYLMTTGKEYVKPQFL